MSIIPFNIKYVHVFNIRYSNSLQVPISKSIYKPPLCSQLPSLKDIGLVIVPSAIKGTPHSKRNTPLFSYLLHHQNEKNI